MFRIILIVLMAALLGSLIATAGIATALGGPVVPSDVAFFVRGGMATLPYTISGVIALYGVQILLRHLGLRAGYVGVSTLVAGGLFGWLMLGFVAGWAVAVVGAGYGLASALALLVLESVWRPAGA